VSSDVIGVILVVSEGTTDIVLAKIDLVVWVGHAQVGDPEKKRIKGRAKHDWWLGGAIGYVIDCGGPGLGPEGGIVDETRLLVGVTNIDDADWYEMGVENEMQDALMEGHTVSLLLPLDNCQWCLDRIVVSGAVTPVCGVGAIVPVGGRCVEGAGMSQCIRHPVPVIHARLYYSLTITNAEDQLCSN
jgi:hypothetical protein